MAHLRTILTEIRNGVGVGRRIPGLTVRQRMRWIAVAVFLPWLVGTGSGRQPTVPVRLPDDTVMSFGVIHPTDLAVIYEILYKGQYAAPSLNSPTLIVDAGAHIGASAVWFASRYPECRIVAFEPSPATCACLRRNVRAFPNIQVHNIALGSSDGHAMFFERVSPFTSSLRPGGATSPISVPTLTLQSALELIGPGSVDLLKLDIEGSEYNVLRASPPHPSRVRGIVGEVHTWMDAVGFTLDAFLGLFDGYDVEHDESGGDHLFRALANSATEGS